MKKVLLTLALVATPVVYYVLCKQYPETTRFTTTLGILLILPIIGIVMRIQEIRKK